MSSDVVITGIGTVCGLGIGIDPLWEGICAGRSAVERLQGFDPSGFACQIGSEVRSLDVREYVPKSYRKATKVMARDIELAVVAVDRAIRDGNLVTPGLASDQPRTYPAARSGAQIGAGLISAELNELTSALVESADANGSFDIRHWGAGGINHLTPLWLLKYLPNMLACHTTIIHDAQGPSNTITCGEASGGLSIGESMRVIQRGSADFCFCGGAESKLNPMTFYRQLLTGRLAVNANDRPADSVRPFDQAADGTVVGEGGGILTLESSAGARGRGARIYAQVAGFGAAHTVWPSEGGLAPDPEGYSIGVAIRAALRDAQTAPQEIDLILPTGTGIPSYDRAEAAALRTIFGRRLGQIPLWSAMPFVGNCGAGAGGIQAAVGAKAIAQQMIPSRINCDRPLEGLDAANAQARSAPLRSILLVATSLGGQNVALILKKAQA